MWVGTPVFCETHPEQNPYGVVLLASMIFVFGSVSLFVCRHPEPTFLEVLVTFCDSFLNKITVSMPTIFQVMPVSFEVLPLRWCGGSHSGISRSLINMPGVKIIPESQRCHQATVSRKQHVTWSKRNINGQLVLLLLFGLLGSWLLCLLHGPVQQAGTLQLMNLMKVIVASCFPHLVGKAHQS